MKIGERGQVTIPKPFREQFELSHSTEVEFVAEQGELILRKKNFHSEKTARSAKIKKWIGCLDGQPEDVDQFIDDIRGPFVEIYRTFNMGSRAMLAKLQKSGRKT